MNRYRNRNRADLARLIADAEASLGASAGDEAQRSLHDLHLHLIELEIQNEDLRKVQARLETARDDYVELFDFAPVGYLSLDRNGMIQKLNLTAAKLLGGEPARLMHTPFAHVLTSDSGNRLFKHLRAAFAANEAVSDEFVLIAGGDQPEREIRLDSRTHVDQDGEPRCLTAVTDISEEKHLERQLRASQIELATLLAAAPVGIFVVEKHVFRSVNARFPEMLRHTEHELLGEHMREVFPDTNEYERVARTLTGQIAAGGTSEVETVMRRSDGHLLNVLLRAAPLEVTVEGADTIFTALDVTEQTRSARAVSDIPRDLELALEGGDIGVYTAQLPSGKMSIEARYLGMLGYLPGDLDLDWTTWLSMIHPEDRPTVDLLTRALMDGELERFEAEYRVQHRRGHWVWLLDRARVFERDDIANSLRLAGTHIDLTRRREAERQVMRLVEHDELTGLLNRRGVLRSIRRIHNGALRSGEPYCLAILDLDHFKQVNDAYGHAVGDEVLRRIASSLTRGLRRADWVGRWGGEEFVVVLPGSTEAQAMHTIERLRNSISEQRIETHGLELRITVSAGLAMCKASLDDPDDVLVLADAALYGAKTAGRNRAMFYGSKVGQQAISVAVLIQDALRTAGIQPAYQTFVELQSRRVVGTEAFARIVDQDGTIVSAASFLEVAQQLGLMHKIDRLLVQAVLQRMTSEALDGEMPEFYCANLSGDLLRHRDIVAELAGALRKHPAASKRARSLVLKVTEQQISTGTQQITETLAPFLELGCRLAIGDCGSSASSYRFMTDLPVDFLELDANLIRLAAESARARAVLSAIVNAARDIGQTTIAKQVEDQATLDRLLELGVDWGQGYLFGRPTDPAPVEKARKRHRAPA